MAQKSVCLTCKNKGCVNYCRFVAVAPPSQQPQQKQQQPQKRAA
jgi:hypothetical protein